MIPVEKAGTLHRHRLLVVEDEVLVLIDTADFVRSQGFEVHERYQPKGRETYPYERRNGK